MMGEKEIGGRPSHAVPNQGWRLQEAAGRNAPALGFPAAALSANPPAMATQLGKRYLCDTCGTEILCNKPGTGSITCCDHEMKVKEAKPLPSSD